MNILIKLHDGGVNYTVYGGVNYTNNSFYPQLLNTELIILIFGKRRVKTKPTSDKFNV